MKDFFGRAEFEDSLLPYWLTRCHRYSRLLLFPTSATSGAVSVDSGDAIFLGTQKTVRDGRTGYWLRWWNAAGERLPWASETIAAKDQELAELRDRERRLLDLLRSQGINAEQST